VEVSVVEVSVVEVSVVEGNVVDAAEVEGGDEGDRVPPVVHESQPAGARQNSVLRPRGSVVRSIGRIVPTLLVMGALAALGYWGHHHGWKLPKFSELISQGEAEGVKWCEEHGVPEAEPSASRATPT
jgi:hypothetical protein